MHNVALLLLDGFLIYELVFVRKQPDLKGRTFPPLEQIAVRYKDSVIY